MIVDCVNCEAKMDFTEVANYSAWHPGEECPVDFYFLKCPKCEWPALVMSWPDPVFGEPERLYPPRERPVDYLPNAIRAAYVEARSCFRGKAFTASTIMCRKTLEGVCREHNIDQGDLVKDLRKLRDEEIIDSRLFEWADALRISGNEAAHDVRIQVSVEDAKDVLDFTNAILEYLFTFREKFEEFKKRRTKKSG